MSPTELDWSILTSTSKHYNHLRSLEFDRLVPCLQKRHKSYAHDYRYQKLIATVMTIENFVTGVLELFGQNYSWKQSGICNVRMFPTPLYLPFSCQIREKSLIWSHNCNILMKLIIMQKSDRSYLQPFSR